MIFFALVLLIVFTALYVRSKVSEPELTRAASEKNLTPPGRLYPRQ